MSDLSDWKLRGPVRTVRNELAEWDRDRGVWRASRFVTFATFRRDGQLGEGESHNPNGSIARWARVYDDDGRLVEALSWMNEGPRHKMIYSYDAAGRRTGAVEIATDGVRRDAEMSWYDGQGRKFTKRFLDPGQQTGK